MMSVRRLAGRLRRDVRGNVLAMVAAAIIPLAALVGSGIDMSRAYMAQARLQMACDAGALAGRRVMVASTVDQNVRDEAVKFFKFNFPSDASVTNPPPYGVAPFTPTVPDGTDGTVRMSASTTVPTTLMGMFGKQNIEISATCFARQDFVNTDIVLVLDTTGSMAQKAVSTDTQTKIEGLRAAVLALYDELAPVQTQLQAAGLRLRYGIVPYSISVNAGAAIRSASNNYLVDNWHYQSRVWEWDGITYNSPTSTSGSWSVASTTYSPASGYTLDSTTPPPNVKKGNCTIRSDTSISYGSVTTGSPVQTTDPNTHIKTTTTTSTRTGTYTDYADSWTQTSGNGNNAKGDCVQQHRGVTQNETKTDTSTETPKYAWRYTQVNYNTSQFKLGTTVSTPTGSNGSNVPSTWNGCVEERTTDSSINSSTSTIPSGAHDLNIDEVPTSNDDTKWRPAWYQIVYTRNSASSSNPTADSTSGTAMTSLSDSNLLACPGEAKRLQAWTRTALSTYVDSLTPDGYTYHDIGMIWGARFVSPNGIFSAENPTTYNSMPVARYIIYMTDGALNTIENAYTSYGVEYLDKRVTGGYTTSADQDNRHNQRFALACQAAKTSGVSIWVVAFASSLSTQLTNCASKSTQASVSTNSAALIAKFAEIGKNIGSLRLTQ
jgi:Flp pilus assembly protein TadG